MTWRIIVTGSRDLASPELVRQALMEQLASVPGEWVRVTHGACPTGADLFAAQWVAEWADGGVFADPQPALWDECGPECPAAPHRRLKRPGDVHHPGLLADYCPGAGPRRNAAMVASGADVVLAFPSGRSFGTWNCVRAARAAGIEVRVVRS